MSGEIIFDNGGGTILKLDLGEDNEYRYAHFYQSGKDAARDLLAYIDGSDVCSWDGHDPDALLCNPTPEQERNGGYRCYNLVEGDTPASLASEMATESGYNIIDFRSVLLQVN